MIDKYFSQDLYKPKYFFHGSPVLLDLVEKRLSSDDYGDGENVDNAVFVTSSFILASAYAFKDKIKENSQELDYKFVLIHLNPQVPVMLMGNVNIDENMDGYIYVFNNDGTFKNDPEGSLQYKSYNNLIPIDIVKIYYADYKKYYQVIKKDEIESSKKV